MGIKISAPAGLDEEELQNYLDSISNISESDITGTLLEGVEKPIVIGDSNSGVIIHGSSGQTLEGIDVSSDDWVEVYGQEIRFSEVQ